VRAFGKYRLLEPLASGGMADVWRAETTGAAGVVKEVALKLVRGEHEARSEFVRMFVEEARLASRLGHANIVQVFEFDEVDGRYYIAMELVRGRSLGRVAERARELGLRLGLPRSVHVGAEVARALAYAHRLAGPDGAPLGLVHRDVSPHNVLVSFEGEVKLADFGIARAMSRAGLTEPGTVKGKLAYMAPEQARGGPLDGRADVFALGVVLWELCAGRRLFARDSDAATLAAVLDGPPPSPPSAWNEAVSPELDAVILGALERDPAARTASAQELATALGRVLLSLARSPEDWDLRALMHQLWPEGAIAAPPTSEPTRVRSRGAADAPAAEAEAIAAAKAVEEQAARLDGPRDEVEERGGRWTETSDVPTRTAAIERPPRRRRRARAAALAVIGVVVAATAAGIASGVGVSRLQTSRIGSRGDTPNPNPTPNPSASSPNAPGAGSRDTGAGLGDTEGGLGDTEGGARARSAGAGAGLASSPSTSSSRRASPPSSPPLEAVRPSVKSKGTPVPAGTPGILHVTSTSWAYVSVDGRPAGETPVTLELPPGRYRVRASHPRHGVREALIEIAPGRRSEWSARLGR
jgi:tRNA A-37 threonylcarbamoyl transferase component Bud32